MAIPRGGILPSQSLVAPTEIYCAVVTTSSGGQNAGRRQPSRNFAQAARPSQGPAQGVEFSQLTVCSGGDSNSRCTALVRFAMLQLLEVKLLNCLHLTYLNMMLFSKCTQCHTTSSAGWGTEIYFVPPLGHWKSVAFRLLSISRLSHGQSYVV